MNKKTAPAYLAATCLTTACLLTAAPCVAKPQETANPVQSLSRSVTNLNASLLSDIGAFSSAASASAQSGPRTGIGDQQKATPPKKDDVAAIAEKLGYVGDLIMTVHSIVQSVDGLTDYLAVSGPMDARMTLDIPDKGVGLGMKITVPLD